jgi:hypothetical protein
MLHVRSAGTPASVWSSGCCRTLNIDDVIAMCVCPRRGAKVCRSTARDGLSTAWRVAGIVRVDL